MSSRAGGSSRKRGKPTRGRNATVLCTCPDCKEGALPGDEGRWVPKWESDTHRQRQLLNRTAEYHRNKEELRVPDSARASGSYNRLGDLAGDEHETQGDGPSKRARLLQSDDELDWQGPINQAEFPVETGPAQFDEDEPRPVVPVDEGDPPPGLYEDPDDVDELVLQMLSHVEERVVQSDEEGFPGDEEHIQGGEERVQAGQTSAMPGEVPPRRSVDGAEGLQALSESSFALPKLSPSRPPAQVLADSHDLWFVRIVLVLVAFLNTKFHLPFKACALILFALHQIFVALKVIRPEHPMPETLKTTFKHLELEDRFHLLITCPTCFRMFEPTTSSDSTCTACEIPLFEASPSHAISDLFRMITQRGPPDPKPKLSVPFQPLSALIADMLVRPGMEEEIDAWKSRGRKDGEYKEIMDGAIWKTLKGPDKKPFFNIQDDSELRIGVTLGLDWFSCARSAFASSHSSGAFSFCISNLPPALRYRPKNLLLSMMTPGPTEPNAEQLQRFNALLVDDLIQLYDHGILVPTALHPEGRLVRIALLGIVCDHPAMCKMCGFADKSHNAAPCTKCHVTSENMFDDECMTGDYRLRSGIEHKERAAEWKNIDEKADREKYFSDHGVRWTEFARLSYFDPVRMTVVDPMHNLLLGIVKTQWYNRWIQGNALRATTEAGTKRELACVHEFLDSLEAPGWIGRLPMRVGEPAGGSLSADEYKTLITTSGAMMLPIVWDMFLPAASEDHKKAMKKWEKTNSNSNANGDATKTPPTPRIHEKEPRLTLLLATAMKILLGTSLDDDSLQRGEALLFEYLALYKSVYGVAAMKPNFHFATHTVPQIRDYGPVPGFWAFLGERLNKVLKGTNLNNQRGGQLEITMMRAFGRDVQLHDLIMHLAHQSEDEVPCTISTRMLTDSAEPRGTVESLAQDPDVAEDALSVLPVVPGPTLRSSSDLPDRVRAALYRHYNSRTKRVYYNTEVSKPYRAPFLTNRVQYHTHVLIDGRRVTPLKQSRQRSAASSIVKVLLNDKLFAGEVIRLFHHHQQGLTEGAIFFAEMRWMKREYVTPVSGDPWKEFPELEFECWTLDEYHEDEAAGIPPAIIPVSAIRCQLARMTDRTSDPAIWLTTSLDRHAITMGEGTY